MFVCVIQFVVGLSLNCSKPYANMELASLALVKFKRIREKLMPLILLVFSCSLIRTKANWEIVVKRGWSEREKERGSGERAKLQG